MRSSVIADAVIFTRRPDLARFASDQLKIKGVSNLLTPDSPEGCVDALSRFPKALLIIDWQYGERDIARILQANRQKAVGPQRSILLIADKVSDQVIATAAEYGVTQIYTDELSFKTLGARISNLIISESLPDEVRKILMDAASARQDGDLKSAAQMLQKALHKHPTNLRLKCEAAEVLMHLGEWQAAHRVLDAVSTAKPPNQRALTLLGRTLMKLGRHDEALKILEQANLLNPHDSARHTTIGETLIQLDKIREAQLHFEQALDIDAKNRDAKIGIGQCQLLEGQVNEALTLLRDVAGDLEMASIFNVCAVQKMRHQKFEEGMNLYHVALKAVSKDQKIQARLYFNMGIGWRRRAEPQKALQCFQTSMTKDPKYKRAQDQVEAIQLAQRAVAARPPAAGAGLETLPDLGGGKLTTEADLDSLLDDNLEEGLYDDEEAAAPPPKGRRPA